MDPKGRQEMLDLIKDIHTNHGKNILLSSHLLPDVEYICEHVVILNNGSVLVKGMIKDLTTASEEYEIRIKGDEEQFKKVLTGMGLSFQKKGSFFMVRSREDLLAKLYPAIKGKEIQIRHATRYRQTLEDIFMGRVNSGGGR
jgi:ABC-2 type transport system ATP-binding protein